MAYFINKCDYKILALDLSQVIFTEENQEAMIPLFKGFNQMKLR